MPPLSRLETKVCLRHPNFIWTKNIPPIALAAQSLIRITTFKKSKIRKYYMYTSKVMKIQYIYIIETKWNNKVVSNKKK